MARLIDADEFERFLMNLPDEVLCEDCCYVVVNEMRKQPTIEAEPVKHGKWIHTDKHFFKKGEDGCVDEWTFDYDFHNGVYCEICGRSICVHCDPDWENDKCKKGHYICSECGSHEKENRDYCPNCGADMRGE